MSVREDALTAGLAVRKLLARVEHGTTQEVVDAGASLYEISHLVRRSTEAVKDRLRAVASFDGKRTDHIAGEDYSANVTAPDVVPKLVKGADEKMLRRVLGESFNVFFHTQITPRPESLHLLLDLPPEVQEAVLTAIEQDFGAGSVSFIPRKP